MEALAESHANVFVPNPEPGGPVEYVFICMEPSLGWWADSRDEAQSKVEAGFRNFLYSLEDFILHHAAQRYLCGSDEDYHITDLSKGGMLVDDAKSGREQRYDRWYPILQEEIDLVATPDAHFFSVGNKVDDFLRQKSFARPLTRVIHYSSQAARARNAAISGHEAEFEDFRDSVSLSDLLNTAKNTLRSAAVPSALRDEVLSRLKGWQLTCSRKKLLFIYKKSFEALPS